MPRDAARLGFDGFERLTPAVGRAVAKRGDHPVEGFEPVAPIRERPHASLPLGDLGERQQSRGAHSHTSASHGRAGVPGDHSGRGNVSDENTTIAVGNGAPDLSLSNFTRSPKYQRCTR